MKKVFHTRIYPIRKMIGGKEVAVNFRGYFTLEENGPRQWRSLGTPNRQIAEKRIGEIALQAQRVQEGLEAPEAQKTAAANLSSCWWLITKHIWRVEAARENTSTIPSRGSKKWCVKFVGAP